MCLSPLDFESVLGSPANLRLIKGIYTLPVDWFSELIALGVIDDVVDNVFGFAVVVGGEGCEGGESEAGVVYMRHNIKYSNMLV